MREHLRAGAAIHNAGHHHAAHDAWEERWLDLKRGLDAPATAADAAAENERTPALGHDGPTPAADERLLHGLIQFTAAVYKAGDRQWTGARSLADGADTYLAPLPDEYRGIDVGSVRTYCTTLAADPEVIERRPPLALTHEGRAVALADLEFPAAAVAAETLAEELGYDEAVIDRAVEYGRADLADGGTGTPFVTLVIDFAARPDDRGTVFARLRDHVRRRRRRETDVDGLFDPE